MPDYALGRISVLDERDLNFPMTLHRELVEVTKLPTAKTWRGQRRRLDQGSVGACVGFTGANWMGHYPIYDPVIDETGMDLYNECKKIDGFPNMEGTSDRYLAKVLVEQGRIERYLWATSSEQLWQWVMLTGPVMVGTNWYESMFNPDSQHRLWIHGAVAGGHEWLIKGAVTKKLLGDTAKHDYYRMRNSWGNMWGDNGEAWVERSVVDRLVFQEQGDALGAVEQRAK